MSKEFKPTHTYHYAASSNNKLTWPNGIPVVQGAVDEYGLIEWIADSEGNVGGYSTEGDGWVIPIKD